MSNKTSLESQLLALRTPQTNLLKQGRVRVSFLYKSSEASAIDTDTHYTICLNGFRQICSINPSFSSFEESLFSVSSKNFDRSSLTKDGVESLDQIIKEFLFKVVSPYFMLSATHKMLEWLVYRYSVHEFNTDDLMISTLPYHETKLFPRVVQLVSSLRDSSNKWNWLIDVQNHGVPLPKASLINYIRNHLSTLEYLVDTVLQLSKKGYDVSILNSFLTSLMVHLMELGLGDGLFILLERYLLEAFRSKFKPSLASSYVVLSHLSTKVSLYPPNPSIPFKLSKILSKMAKYSMAAGEERDYLLTLLVVFEFQELDTMSEAVASSINTDLMLEMLEKFQSKYFLGALISRLIDKCEEDESYVKVLSIIDGLKLSSWVITRSLKTISAKFNSNCSTNCKERLTSIVQKFERIFPLEFDEALSDSDLMSQENLIVSSFYARLDDENINVFNGLLHSSKRIRLYCAMNIAKNYKKILKINNHLLVERVISSLTNTWTESNPTILIELLSCRDLFVKLIPVGQLLDYGKKLLPRCIEMIEKEEKRENKEAANDWRAVERSCFNLFSNLEYKDDALFWDLFVDYFLPLEDAGLSIFSIIFNTPIEKTNKNLFSKLKTISTPQLELAIEQKDFGTSIDLVSKRIAEYLIKNPHSPLLNILSQGGAFRRNILGLCILYHVLTSVRNFEDFNKFSLIVLKLIESILEKTRIKKNCTQVKCVRDAINSHLKRLRRHHFSEELTEFFALHLVNSMVLPKYDDQWYWSRQEVDQNCLYKLFCCLLHHSHSTDSPVIRRIVPEFLRKLDSHGIVFLAGLWSKSTQPLHQYRSLCVSSFVLKNKSLEGSSITCLLVPLLSPNPSVRSAGCALLHAINSDCPVICSLTENSLAIENDPNEVTRIIARVFSESTKKPSKKRETGCCDLMMSHLKSSKTPPLIQLDLMKLMLDINSIDCLQIYIEQGTHLVNKEHLDDSEKQILTLIGYKIIKMLPTIEDLSDREKLSELLSYILKSNDLRPALLSRIKSSYVNRFNDNVTAKIFLIEQFVDSMVIHADKLTRKKLKKLLNDGGIVAEMIDKLTFIQPATTLAGREGPTQRKRPKLERRTMSLDGVEWRKVTLLLEVFVTRENFSSSTKMLEVAFDLLKESLLSVEKCSFEYFRLILLITISSCLNQDDVDLKIFDLTHIFETLHQARLRETQMQALDIILKVSNEFKDEVLQGLMKIFGSIGSNMIKCDDQYAQKALDDIMGTIISNLKHNDADYQQLIIGTFTDAANDIPAHRRLYLFHKLASLLGQDDCLWFIAFRLIQRIVYDVSQKKHLTEFIRALVCSFPGSTQLKSLISLMNSCLSILPEGSFDAFNSTIRFVDSERKAILYEIVDSVLLIVSCDDFVAAIAEAKWSDVEQLFQKFLESNLLLIDHSIKDESKSKSTSKLFTKTSLRILEKVNLLLPGPEFVSVLHRLLDSPAIIVRRKAMELFNSRLTSAYHDKFDVALLRGFIPPILSIIEKVEENTSDQQIINSQTGLMSIKLLAKLLKNDVESHENLKKALDSIVHLAESEPKSSPNLLASVILSIAQLVASLQNECFSSIPSVAKIFLKHLSASSEILVLSCLIAVTKITKSFSNFLNPYLKDILIKICSLDKQLLEPLKPRIMVCQQTIASSVSLRILISAIEGAREELNSQESLHTLLSILSESLAHSNKIDIEGSLNEIQKLVINLLDYRFLNAGKISREEIDGVEDKSLEVVSHFVPKLSESTFRSFFYKVYDWAILCKEGTKELRLITFYRLTNILADKLKSLFCAFAAPYIVNNCAQQLKAFHIHPDDTTGTKKRVFFDEDIGHLVIINILNTLSKCFLHDINSSFSTKDRVSKLASPIVDQITNDFGSNELYFDRINDGIVYCVKHLVKAVNDHNIVKDLNYRILLKTREDSPKIRCQALNVVHQMMLAMVEEYLPLLPEAIPFLAELHEDDAEEVQKLLTLVIADIERIFGEPISSYF
ncbi:HEAT repeat containing 1 homolog l(2)k09022 [Brevipalpus obovatus]|uniref:HEAT repeat containing 1 homolog l(2)k09022 n=1 Tax=Brevipalpus obovatus TaxID=246614 RepID=UPI003D9FA7A7